MKAKNPPKSQQPAIAARLRETGWLAERPADVQAVILEAAIWHRAVPGEEFIHGPSNEGGIYVIADGIAEVSFVLANPDNRAQYFVRAGFWSGHRPLLGRARTLSITARTPLVWGAVPLARLRQMLVAEPAWWEHIAQLAEDSAELVCWAMADLTLTDSRARIAGLLLQLAGCRRPDDAGRKPLSIELSQSDIATVAAMSRSTLGKILAEFTKNGWVETCYTRLEVRAPEQLRALVNGAAD
ncbi:MAG: Crp/Fnr family transcriptional regulator [Polymorphobacter sp.]|uniref:Crp/Fnr family transcriptional regulator n=1 Tax=Polymorphobacter sp. TaxID=1909290 RepID=UPI003A8A9A15